MKNKVICLLFTVSLLTFLADGLNAQQTNTAEIDAPIGGSIEHIVAFYNQYANVVKTTDRVTILKHHVREVDMRIPLLMRPLMSGERLGSFTNQNIIITETFINGEGTDDTTRRLNDFLPVNGRPQVSLLLPSHVINATCVRQENYLIVTIKLRDEPLATIFQTAQMNIGGNKNMSAAERENLMNELLSRSGYGSSMDLSFTNMRDTQQSSGSGNRNFSSMDGGFQNGTITAVFNQEGQLTSLTHYLEINLNISALLMNARMNNVSRMEYQVAYHNLRN